MASSTPSLVVESSMVSGDLGFFLLAACLRTLDLNERLGLYRGCACPEGMTELPFEPFDAAPWLKIGEQRFEAWSSDLVMVVYELVGGWDLHDALALDLWARALGGESQTYWEMQHLSSSRQLMASLVERGANPLRALKIKI